MSRLVRLAIAGGAGGGKTVLADRLVRDSNALPEPARPNAEEPGTPRERHSSGEVAYRYFATSLRQFVIADAAGLRLHTRGVVGGVSTADVALIVVDAADGLTGQARRHVLLAALLGVPHLVLCVNKMDTVGWSRRRFEEIGQDFRGFTAKLDVQDPGLVPVSALHGDNIVHRSMEMPWYDGMPLLHHLERVPAEPGGSLVGARFPVQYVISQAARGFRGYAGTVAGGVLRAGDEVVVLPSQFRSRVRAIWSPGGGEVTEAVPRQAVTVQLDDDPELTRGDLICAPGDEPYIRQDFEAMVCWFSDRAGAQPAKGLTVWFTGLSGAGKTAVATEVARRLLAAGRSAYVLDGDRLREGLNDDLGFSPRDRAENVRRVGEVARLFADAGIVALVSLISPYRADRDRVRALHRAAGLPFVEVFVDTPLEICAARDPKGLYASARAGRLKDFTGMDSPYEAPPAPELVLRPEDGDPCSMASIVLTFLNWFC